MAGDRTKRACLGWGLTAIALALQLVVMSRARNLGGLVVLPHLGLTVLCAWLRRSGDGVVAFMMTGLALSLVAFLGSLTHFVNGFTYAWGPGRGVAWTQASAALLLAGGLNVIALHHSAALPAQLADIWPRRRVAIHVIALVAGTAIATAVVLQWGDALTPADCPVSIRLLAAPWLVAAAVIAVVEVALHARLPRRSVERDA